MATSSSEARWTASSEWDAWKAADTAPAVAWSCRLPQTRCPVRSVDAQPTEEAPPCQASQSCSKRGSSQTAITRSDGTFVLSGVPSGPLTVTAQLAGFALASRSFVFDQQ